jgi:hypothetical protein
MRSEDNLKYATSGIFSNFTKDMLPDFPHKLFKDRRNNYSLLMETLAMDSTLFLHKQQALIEPC